MGFKSIEGSGLSGMWVLGALTLTVGLVCGFLRALTTGIPGHPRYPCVEISTGSWANYQPSVI